ncbi:MAG: DUF2069 domain-containing protein [Gammaproteobacteria bacterium]|nr:DUF2069 domain-containing protein [Gammaproteobacteria bacterium]
MTDTANPPIALQRARLIVLAACYGLLLNFLVSSLMVLNGLAAATLVIWLVQIIPLAIFLPGLHQSRLRSFAWVSFVILLYFMHGVLVAFDPGRRWFGLIEVSLCAVAFVALIIYIRQYRQYYQVRL